MISLLAALLLVFISNTYCDNETNPLLDSIDLMQVPLINNERHIVVVIASYNNLYYVLKNLKSVLDQNYSNYHVIYIDDCSTDATLTVAKRYVARRKKSDKVHFIHNEKRMNALYNQYTAVTLCRDTDLIVILDGDDWLANNYVLSYLNNVYSDNKTWLTYGQFTQYPTGHQGWGKPMPEKVIKQNGFREYEMAPCHLRTFYAGLFKQIKKEDLMYEGSFFKMTGDNAFMFPMIEMAREDHFKFISKILMVYNAGNPISDHRVVEGLQYKLDLVIRSRQKYDPIATPFLSVGGGLW
jgi:glycosyltransferase involved in cell wall biosynthesis